LVNDQRELERLNKQGALLTPATRFILDLAGVRTGMRVLDLGAGTGDVAFDAADRVGPSGEVVGLDQSAEALAVARTRAAARGLRNVTFVEGDLRESPSRGLFDAITARFVLRFVDDPVAVLRAQAANLQTGGVMIPIEFDLATARSTPEAVLVTKAFGWMAEGFKLAKIDMSMGPRLWSMLEDAGLQPTGMIGVQPLLGPNDPDAAAIIAGTVRTSMPVIERTGVATATEVDVESLQARVSAELAANGAIFAYPMLLSAWGTPV
jgi:SAM-dependent methyltransferase